MSNAWLNVAVALIGSTCALIITMADAHARSRRRYASAEAQRRELRDEMAVTAERLAAALERHDQRAVILDPPHAEVTPDPCYLEALDEVRAITASRVIDAA